MKDKSILAVDDETELLKMLQSVFERAGYTKITTASSGKEALAIFRENQRTEVKCSMHPMKSMITSCVPSVRSSFPSQDSVITQKKTASMSVSVTGS